MQQWLTLTYMGSLNVCSYIWIKDLEEVNTIGVGSIPAIPRYHFEAITISCKFLHNDNITILILWWFFENLWICTLNIYKLSKDGAVPDTMESD